MCGHIGCGKSHIKGLEFAIKNNWSSVLILEDDFYFTEDYKDGESFNKWDVMLLAQGYQQNKDSDYKFLKKACCATTTSGYIIIQFY